jgi:hypothetical protein
MENKNTTSFNTNQNTQSDSSPSAQSLNAPSVQSLNAPSVQSNSSPTQSAQSFSSPTQSAQNFSSPTQSAQSFSSPTQSTEMQSENTVSPSSLFEINIEKPKGNVYTMENTDTMDKMEEKTDTRPDNLDRDNNQNTISTNDFNKTAPMGIHDNIVKPSLHDNMHVQKISNHPSMVEEYRGVVIVKKESNKSIILKWIGWLILMCIFVIIILWWVNSFSSYSCSKILDTGGNVKRYRKQVSWRKPLTQVRMFDD